MPDSPETLFICSCEDSFSPDHAAIAAALGRAEEPASIVQPCRHLCGIERERVARAARTSGAITIACRQEEAGFRGDLDDLRFQGERRFVDIRNAAGWSAEGAAAGPKMAALIAAARLPAPALPFVTLESRGVALIYGRDETAIGIGERLSGDLDVTVLLRTPGEVTPPPRHAFPIARGRISRVSGWLGAFDILVDDFALARPSSRAALTFTEPRDGARSRCDIVIDATGDAPLIGADGLRDGYLRAHPDNSVSINRLIEKARGLVGTFDKPRYVTFRAELCAHSRSRIAGCTRCLDLCPTGAITPAGDHVAISPEICAGCGSCASVCPTGAASYALPPPEQTVARMRTLLRTYRAAGGVDPVLVVHDEAHGEPLLDALARFGNGLPAHAIPFAVHETTGLTIGAIAAAFAYGAAGILVLASAKPAHDLAALRRLCGLASILTEHLGHSDAAFTLIETDDPDRLGEIVWSYHPASPIHDPAYFMPLGAGRELTMLALRAWHAAAPRKPDRVALQPDAPFGAVSIDADRCTLCLACVSACPTAALTANPDRPELRFQQDLCVQCGLCRATCPEKVISLVPQLDFAAIQAPAVTLKHEDPYTCDRCGTPFGTRSTIERVKARLNGQHWMFAGSHADRIKLIGYCENCRIEVAATAGFDPHSGPERPHIRTTEDYLSARDAGSEKD